MKAGSSGCTRLHTCEFRCYEKRENEGRNEEISAFLSIRCSDANPRVQDIKSFAAKTNSAAGDINKLNNVLR